MDDVDFELELIHRDEINVTYISNEQQKAFNQLVKEENLSAEKTEKLIEDYLFAEREPLRDEILDLIEGEKPSLLQRKTLGEQIMKSK